MPTDNPQELLEALPSVLYIDVVETIQAEKNLTRQRWDNYSQRFQVENLPESDKVTVPSTNPRLSLFERWNVCSAHYLVVGVGVLAVVCLWITNLVLDELDYTHKWIHTSTSRKFSGSP